MAELDRNSRAEVPDGLRTNVALKVTARPDDDRLRNNGISLFARRRNSQVLAAEMQVNGTGIMNQGFGDWKKIWIDLPISDGKFAVVLFFLDGTDYSFDGASQHEIIFGGIEAIPQP